MSAKKILCLDCTALDCKARGQEILVCPYYVPPNNWEISQSQRKHVEYKEGMVLENDQ